jgi:hypothetical protein
MNPDQFYAPEQLRQPQIAFVAGHSVSQTIGWHQNPFRSVHDFTLSDLPFRRNKGFGKLSWLIAPNHFSLVSNVEQRCASRAAIVERRSKLASVMPR